MKGTTLAHFKSFLLTLCVFACLSDSMPAQWVAVPGHDFEAGGSNQEHPEGWTLSGGQGKWETGEGDNLSRSISVTGDGRDSNHWLSAPLDLESSTLYRLSFQARSLGPPYTSGTPVTGPRFCNRDLGKITAEWKEYSSIFITPEVLEPEATRLRYGQWHLNGSIAFDTVFLCRVQPMYVHRYGIVLGEGERLHGNEYCFQAPFDSTSRNHCRPLAGHRCGFNTNRWTFGMGSEVVYRHRIADRRHLKACVEVNVPYHRGGVLAVSAGVDGKTWRRIGTLKRTASGSFEVPGDLFPAKEVWIRLAPSKEASGRVAFQVNGYAFSSRVTGEPDVLSGRTQFLAVERQDPEVAVSILSLGDAIPGGDNVITARIDNRKGRRIPVRISIMVWGDRHLLRPPHDMVLEPGEQTVRLPYAIHSAGRHRMSIHIAGATFSASTTWNVADLFRSDSGERLPGSTESAGLWWASSGWKISRARPLPTRTGPAIRLSAARNETEAVQLVVRPGKKPLKKLQARVETLQGPKGAVIPASRIDLLRVRYVMISRPTDATGVAALWPDPLPPFNQPVDIEANTNQPIWIRVNVPRKSPPGLYRGSIILTAEEFEAQAPLEVEVFDFTLPDRMTCTTAFGFRAESVWRYQNLRDPAHRRAVLAKYLENMSRHHISPYDPAPLDPLKVTWPKKGAGGFEPVFDWTAWDAALDRAFSRYHFTTFRLGIPGLGGGSFHARREPAMLGYKEDTPEYKAAFRNYCIAMQEHLREKGWLDKAFVYWFDEPSKKDYAFVMNGFHKLKEAAPDITRMLTEQVEKELVGGPNIWCPVSYNFDPDAAQERRRAGDRFWWYVCCGPKAPYCTLFIDHPATEMRVWLWQTWKRRISGILVWATNYWTSSAAYPDRSRPQNPYEDPMSWTSGYSTPAGVKRAWGNGDGRFMYPPEAAADGTGTTPVLEGPVDSIRWEMLRDGIEDYEYLAILDRLLKGNRKKDNGRLAGMLAVPESITRSMTEFTKDPTPIETRRREVAGAIEKLSRRK